MRSILGHEGGCDGGVSGAGVFHRQQAALAGKRQQASAVHGVLSCWGLIRCLWGAGGVL